MSIIGGGGRKCKWVVTDCRHGLWCHTYKTAEDGFWWHGQIGAERDGAEIGEREWLLACGRAAEWGEGEEVDEAAGHGGLQGDGGEGEAGD